MIALLVLSLLLLAALGVLLVFMVSEGEPDVERGAAFTIGACARVARHRGISAEDYFQMLLAEGAAKTGRTTVPLA